MKFNLLRATGVEIFVMSLISCVLSGCNVGPNYHAPQSSLDPSWGASLSSATTRPSSVTTQPVAATPWWTSLNDPILDSLIDRAVKSNNDLRLAEARVREARARRAATSGQQYPTVDAQAGYSRQRFSQNAAPFNAFNVPNFPWEFDLYQAGFDASWEIDVFGGIRRQVEAAKADENASEEDRRGVLLSVQAEVARNYVDLRGDQHRLEIAQRNLQAQRQTLDLTTNQMQKGVATQLDVTRANAEVKTTEALIPTLRNMQWQEIHRLAVLIGQQPDALVEELSPEKPIPVPPQQVPVGLPAELLRRRPDIRRAERELAAATARIGAAVADLYPRFSLTGSFAMQSEEPKALFDWPSRSFTAGPAVQWPVFEAGRLRSVVKIRTAQQEEAIVRYEQTVLVALEETHDAIVAFDLEKDRQDSLQQAVKANQDATEMADELYRQGLGDFLAVLDAQRSLYLSEDALARSQQASTTALVALYKAIGGGWDADSDPKASTVASNSR